MKMGIISRFKDIMSSNINALLDKAENPEKMIDQYLRNLQDDLGKVKAETASVMAEETRCKRALDECNAEIEKFQGYAVKAVEAGNDDDARQFLAKKNQLVEKQASLQQAYNLAADNAAKMRQMHDKLVSDINELNTKKEAIKAKLAVAKTQERVNKIGSSVAGAENNMSAFGRMEAKVDKMLDEANAMAELNDISSNDPTAALAAKYEDKKGASAVEDELAALKASLGK
jgi:phage shock protein A